MLGVACLEAFLAYVKGTLAKRFGMHPLAKGFTALFFE
jgi:hypothetical protein